MKFGTCFTTSDPHPSLAQLRALRSVGITRMRVSIALAKICLTPGPLTWQWGPLDTLMKNLSTAGIVPYHNACGCPPWASEDQPAYIGLVEVWPPDAPDRPASYGGDAWWNEPRDGSIHFFDQDPATNPKWAAVDQQMPARPYLESGKVPHVSADFMFTVGQQLARRYGSGQYGAWNEPGGAFFYPPIRYDKENLGGMGDVIRDRFMPEIVKPFSAGVRSVLGNAWTHVGNEADGDGVLDRCLEIDGESEPSNAGPLKFPPRPYDVISYHSYGVFSPVNMHYATMEAFKAVTKERGKGRPEWIGEINAPTPDLLEFTRERGSKHDVDAIYFLRPGMFFEGDGNAIPNDPKVSAEGLEFAKVFAANDPDADPIRTTMPVKRHRAVREK